MVDSWGKLEKVDFDTLPHGKFGKVVRELVDPLWGIDECDIKCINVTVEGEVRTTETRSFDVDVVDVEEAKRRALDMFDGDYENVYFSEVIHVTPVLKQR